MGGAGGEGAKGGVAATTQACIPSPPSVPPAHCHAPPCAHDSVPCRQHAPAVPQKETQGPAPPQSVQHATFRFRSSGGEGGGGDGGGAGGGRGPGGACGGSDGEGAKGGVACATQMCVPSPPSVPPPHCHAPPCAQLSVPIRQHAPVVPQ